MQPSIISILSLFHDALDAIHYVNGIVFNSQHLSQPSIVTSGLWLIQWLL